DREGGELDGPQREEQGEEIEKDMGRIREQRQGIGPKPAGKLGDQGCCGEEDGELEAPGDALVQMMFVVLLVMMFGMMRLRIFHQMSRMGLGVNDVSRQEGGDAP